MKRYDETITGAEPVDAAALAAVIRGTNPAETALLTSYCKVARQQVESHCRIAVVQRTVTMFIDRFPWREKQGMWWDGVRELPISELYDAQREVFLPLPPLQTVTSIMTYDDSDAGTVFDAANYYVDASDKRQQGRVVLRTGAVWPNALRVANAVKFIYVAGYADNTVPEEVKQAILGVGAYLYANRGDCGGDCVGACGMGALLSSFVVRDPR
jgi:uncharacterized phiE125 gp8 family phage protein